MHGTRFSAGRALLASAALLAACSPEPSFDDGGGASTAAATGATTIASGPSSSGTGGQDAGAGGRGTGGDASGTGGEAQGGDATTTASPSSGTTGGGDGGAGGAGTGGDGSTVVASGTGGAGGSDTCHDGVVGAGETCDDDSELCVDCTFVCPEGTIEADGYPGCYQLLTTIGSFLDAPAACANRSFSGLRGRLPTPRTSTDLELVVAAANNLDVWIGATDLANEGTFRWLDEDGRFPFPPGGGQWAPLQPDDVEGGQDCVVARGSDAALDDRSCSTSAAVVCEIVPGWAIQAACGNGRRDAGEECEEGDDLHGRTCEGCDLRCPEGWTESPIDRVCFRLATTGASRDIALTACVDAGGRLATPDDPVDVAFSRYVCDLEPTDRCWIGAQRLISGDAFVWDGIEPFDYPIGSAPWATGQPDGDGDYVSLVGGNIEDAPGAEGRGALCEIGDADQ